MNLDINTKIIHQKMDEYLMWLKNTGIVTNQLLLAQFSKQLHSIHIFRIYNASGDAHVGIDKLEYCYERIVENMILHGTYYLDEVLFHEFTHLLNSFHQSIRGPKSFMISEAIEKKMGCFTNIELLEKSDCLLYNQDPCLGVILLDEYIAQSVAQFMVKQKYDLLNESNKRKYSKDELNEFKSRTFTTNICIPPLRIFTSLADYPEFDVCASWFIKKYHLGSTMDFVRNSFDVNYLKKIIENLDSQTAEEMYVDLCYLGLIKERVYINRGFIKCDNPKDPVNNPRNIYKVFQKILKR